MEETRKKTSEKNTRPTPEQISQKLRELASLSIDYFLESYELFNDQGLPLDFKSHPFLAAMYRDFSPIQAIMKCSQIGVSTMANIKALWLAANKKIDIIYSLPSASDAHDFVSAKTNRLISHTPVFQAWIHDTDSVEQKRVLDNVIYFRGTKTKQAALSIPADLYVADEVDRSDDERVRQYLSRLSHSDLGWRWYMSNPSVIGHGVSEWWELSDQKHWFVPCDCGRGEYHGWQYLTMDNIQGNPPVFACRFCGKELDRTKGQWVKKYRNREVSGWWLSLLMAPWVSAGDILGRKRDMTDEQFANFVLGEPYTGVKNTLTRQSFFQNLTSSVNSQSGRIIIGVDTGEAINVVMGNKEGIFYYNKTNDYAELVSLLTRYPNSIAVIDQGGDIIGPRKLRERFKNRIYLCFFARDRKNDELVRWNDDEGSVLADRNKMIQLVVDEFSEKRIPVNGTEGEWLDYYLEWARMYRTVEKSETGPPVYEWHKPLSGRADYPFCTVYWRIGMDKFSETRAKFVSPDGLKMGQPALDSFTGKLYYK